MIVHTVHMKVCMYSNRLIKIVMGGGGDTRISLLNTSSSLVDNNVLPKDITRCAVCNPSIMSIDE
jgi:hypothetical protein